MPEEATQEKEIARRFGPRSTVIFLFKWAGKVIGALAFGTLTRSQLSAERIPLIRHGR